MYYSYDNNINHNRLIGDGVIIKGNEKHSQGTVLNWDHMFEDIPAGYVTLDCKKLDDRVSCICALSLQQTKRINISK